MTKYKIIKDCDGNLLYKKKIETDEHFRRLRKRQTDSQYGRDESLVGNWKNVSSGHILRRIDRNFTSGSQYRKQYKCNHCEYTAIYRRIIEDHLRNVHSIDADNMHDLERCCHACKKAYNKLYEEEKYRDWDGYKRRKHHWELCSKVQERIESDIPAQASTWTDNIFDTTSLPLNVRHELLNRFEKKYISDKHTYSECQPRYIDNITTAYQSDIMKGILSHEN